MSRLQYKTSAALMLGVLLATTQVGCSAEANEALGAGLAVSVSCVQSRDHLATCGLLQPGPEHCDTEGVNWSLVSAESAAAYSCEQTCVTKMSCEDASVYYCGDGSADGGFAPCFQACLLEAGWTACADGNGAYPAAWACDGNPDCDDNTDEAGCGDSPANEASCGDAAGSKYPVHYRCDGVPDCPNNADEEGCSYPSFTCDGYTYSDEFKCDGWDDCDDGSDEAGCPTHTCGDGTEISAAYKCDDYNDCDDGSDEAGCSRYVCE
jgi:hypothetical protein